MKRIWIAAALAVLALAGTSSVARADQTLRFNIVGAGHVTGDGIDCVRNTPGGAQTGDCDEHVVDGEPQDCGGGLTCPNPGFLGFQASAIADSGFAFSEWSHPQCGPIGGQPPFTRNPCGVIVALGGPNPDLTVNATFVDNQDPTATLTDPAANAFVRGTIAIKATATDNAGVPGVVLNAAGRVLAQFTAPPFQTTFDTRTIPDGVIQVSATATDSSNRTGSQAVSVTVDNTNPTLTVNGPNDVTLGPGVVPTWVLNAGDATTAVTVACSVVPVGRPARFDSCTSPTTERLVNQADGRYTLTVRATDAAGNFVEQTRAFAVDTGPPETAIVSGPDDGSRTTDTAFTWGLTASEPGATFACRIFVAATGPGPFGPCSAAASHSVSGLAPGTYTFESRATDVFGNVDPTPAHRTVTVFFQAPPQPPPVVHETTIIQQVVVVTLTWKFDYANKRQTKLTSLRVAVPAGSTVTALCPKGCSKKTFVKRNASGIVSLKALAKKPLKVRTRITLTVSKPGAVSAVKVFEIQKAKGPLVTSLCQPPGAAKPGKCA